MKRVNVFDDGTELRWIDRETVRYTEGEQSVDIWLDYGDGIFRPKRVIHVSSIKAGWRDPSSRLVSDSKVKEIIDKVGRIVGRDRIIVEE